MNKGLGVFLAAAALVVPLTMTLDGRERLRDDESKRAGAAAVERNFNSYLKKVSGPGGAHVDLTPTLRRIAALKSLRDAGLPHHEGDGTVFLNLTDRDAARRPLPSAPRGYYIEYVHPPGRDVRWPGPQRVIVGRKGEAYYSPDHYRADSIVTLHRDLR